MSEHLEVSALPDWATDFGSSAKVLAEVIATLKAENMKILIICVFDLSFRLLDVKYYA